MVQSAGGARFLFEPAKPVGITADVFVQNFDGYFAAEPGVAGTVHLPHPSGAQRREDFVRSQKGACGKLHARLVGDQYNGFKG
jgi:hypothetical protein